MNSACLLFLIFPISFYIISAEPTLQYLRGVPRLSNTDYVDFYFSCNVAGRFLRWKFNEEPLTGFTNSDTGLVVVEERSMYEYTATLLSAQPDPQGGQNNLLDSVLVISFNNGTPSAFEISCSSTTSSSTDNSARVVAGVNEVVHRQSTGNEVVLDFIISKPIFQRSTRNTRIFVCGSNDMQQFFRVGSLPVGFGRHDTIGEYRTILSDNGYIVDIQGILVARQPYVSTSILFVSEDSDATVTCFYNTFQVQLTSEEYGGSTTDSMTTPQPLSSTVSSFASPPMQIVIESATYSETIVEDLSQFQLDIGDTVSPDVVSGTQLVTILAGVAGVIGNLVIVVMVFVIALFWWKRCNKCEKHSVSELKKNTSCPNQAKTIPAVDKSQCTGSGKDCPAVVVVDYRLPLSSCPLISDSTSSNCSQIVRSISCPVSFHYWEPDEECPRRPTCSSFSKTEEDIEKIFVSNMGSLLIGSGLRHRRTSSLNVAYVQPDTPDCIRKDKSPEKTEVNFTQQECVISPDKCSQEKDNTPAKLPDKIDVNYTQQECEICPDKCPQEKDNARTRVCELQCYNTCYNSREFEILSFHITDYVTLMKKLSSHGDMDFVWFDMENGLVSDPNKHFWPVKFPDAPMSIPLTNLLYLTPLSRGPMIKYMSDTSKDINLVLSEVLEVMKDHGLTVSEVLEIMKDGFTMSEVLEIMKDGFTMSEVQEIMKDGFTMSEVLEIMKDGFQAHQVMQLLCNLDVCSWKDNKAICKISPASQLTQR